MLCSKLVIYYFLLFRSFDFSGFRDEPVASNYYPLTTGKTPYYSKESFFFPTSIYEIM